MLQPLWESRDRYEELKQMDDAVREVSRLCEGLGSTGPPCPATPPRGPPTKRICPTETPGLMQRCSILRELTAWEAQSLGGSLCPEIVVVQWGSRTSLPLPPASP